MQVQDIALQVASDLSAKYGDGIKAEVDRSLRGPPTRGIADMTVRAIEIAQFIIAVTPFVIDIWNETREQKKTADRSAVAEKVLKTFDTADIETAKKFENMDDDVKKDVVDSTIKVVAGKE